MGASRSIAGQLATLEAIKAHQEGQLAAAERAEALLRKPRVWTTHNREAQQALALLVRLAGGHGRLLEQVDANEVVLEGVLAKLTQWRDEPVAFVRECLRAEPDAWQVRALDAIAAKPRLALSCSKGPGKTTFDVWCALWYIATRPHPRIAVASGNEDQLYDTLWAELAKWYGRSFLLGEWLELGKTRLSHRDASDTWWCSARTWSRSADPAQAGDSLAGLHEKYALVVLDEAGSMPESLLAAAEGVLTGGGDQRLVVSGNPTAINTALHRAAVTDRAHWHVIHVSGDPEDPERSPRISLDWATRMIERYGRDSPFVQVAVLGQFPTSALHTLVSREDVQVAIGRQVPDEVVQAMPVVLGVDVARYGLDATVFCRRQGRRVVWFQVHRGLSNMEVADRVCRLIDSERADGTFIDAGAGGGVIDRCLQMGYVVSEVAFAGQAQERRFANKRAEMFWKLGEWVRGGGCLPNVPELIEELPAFMYAYKRDRMQVVDKEEIRAVLGRSPDHADALALTFAETVVAKSMEWDPGTGRHVSGIYGEAADPFARYARFLERNGR